MFANYAYTISSWDLRFVALLDAENGQRDMYKRSYKIWANGYYDYWLCQMNRWWYKRFVDDKKFREDWKRQIDRCYELYKWWTKFYGKSQIPKTIKRFIILD